LLGNPPQKRGILIVVNYYMPLLRKRTFYRLAAAKKSNELKSIKYFFYSDVAQFHKVVYFHSTMKLLLAKLLICAPLFTLGQTFSTVYNNPFISNGSGSGFSIFLEPDTLIVIGNMAVQETGGTGNSFLLKYDLNGLLLEENFWDPELNSFSSTAGLWGGADFTQDPDSSFISITYNEFDNTDFDNIIAMPMIQILDQYGNEIIREEIEYEPDGTSIIGIKSKNPNEHLLYGSVWDDPGVGALTNNGLLLNCNSAGETNWVQRYDSVAGVRFMDVFPDGSTILGGYVYWGGTGGGGPFNSSDQIIIKTDEIGNEKWRYIFGSIGSEGYCPVLASSSGDIIVAGKRNNFSSTNQGALWVQRIQDNGNSYEITDEILMDENNMYNDYISYGIKEVLDGTFVGYGFGELPYDEELLESPERGFIYKVDQNLDSLWTRYYGHFTDESDTEGYFYDMVEGPDSCLYLTGSSERGFESGLIGLGNVWLVKLDQHGCLEPGCHLIEDTTDNIVQIIGLQNSLKVFPNPVRENFTLQIELPPEFSPPSSSVIKILDMNGREVKQIQLNNIGHQHTEQINVSELAAGAYTLHWMNAGLWYDSFSLIVND